MTPEQIKQAIEDLIGTDRVRLDGEALDIYGRDWTKIHTPRPRAIAFPRSTEDVQAIVRFARENKIALVPSGGRTGLSAGAVAANDELVVVMDYMNKVIDFNPVDRSVTVQAGMITEQLQKFAEDQGLYYPVDFASAGSSQIGGNISTNAGGIKVIKYGMTRDWVLGLKVVTGAGDVLELNKGLIKNNTGYDLRHLFIGAEGTLGIITEATIKLTRPPKNLTVMVLGTPTMQDVMQVLKAFQSQVDLTAFEFFSNNALDKVVAHHQLQRPFDSVTDYYALLEFEAETEEVMDRAMQVFEHCMEEGWVEDGSISQSEAQAQSLWSLREFISETISHETPYKNDLSVLVSKVPEFLKEVDDFVAETYPGFEIVWFGHIGDGNLHLNILKPKDMEKDAFFEKCHHVSDKVFAITQRYAGSVSAEHGVGLVKKDFLHFSRSPEELAYMKAIMQVFDPGNIMNPGKMFDA
ncbi:glycolate oxidase, subunit GlcD [Marinospirillum celere]|uniref:D-2-hydroxyglutarate dehydrogenase n=1 Tax=Marinospirillum celere TaxID=1122252 RepID=A0A1I1JMW0_9GAMM|nr:FAD-binding oxidoreductase [Marinospirillum celere]SFC47898.1 glycolate oxidase, subunit GlcD [Marinospirillum celere]